MNIHIKVHFAIPHAFDPRSGLLTAAFKYIERKAETALVLHD